MATGIQTGIRRGTRSGSSPLTQTKQPWRRLLEAWTGQTQRVKTAVVGTLAFIVLALTAFAWQTQSNRYVDLYPFQLSERDLPQISRVLLEYQLDHQVTPTQDGILLHPKDRIKAQAVLAQQNLPLHPVLTQDQVQPSAVRSAAERKQLEQRLLAGEITLALRAIEGVNDAQVTLAFPQGSTWVNRGETTASVMLTLAQGRQLSSETVNGIAKLVAFSVPGLTQEKVQIVSALGEDLSKDSSGLGALEKSWERNMSVRAQEEERMRAKVQQAFDRTFPGRTQVLVNLELDFSTLERRIYTPGGPEHGGQALESHQSVIESLDKGESEGSETDRTYRNSKIAENFKLSEDYQASLSEHPRAERVSVAVLADGVSEDEARSMALLVKGALGLQEHRGDFVHVDSTPWDRVLLSGSEQKVVLPAGEENGVPISQASLLALLALQSVLLVGTLGFGLSRRRSPAITEQVGTLEATAPVGGLVDQLRNKIGQTQHDLQTGRQPSEALHGMVAERPTQVAQVLRSTWLS